MTSSGETPSSPVGCGRVKEFLCTEWAIGQVFVASNCVWMSIFCSFISLIFWVIAFGTVGWGRADNASVKRELGLWLECHTGAYTGCSYLSPSDISDGYVAAEVFACFGLVCLLIIAITYILYVAIEKYKKQRSVALVIFYTRWTTGIFFLLTLILYSATWTEGLYDRDEYDTWTSYSYDLGIVAVTFEILGAILMTFEVTIVRNFLCPSNPNDSYNQAKPLHDNRVPRGSSGAAYYQDNAGYRHDDDDGDVFVEYREDQTYETAQAPADVFLQYTNNYERNIGSYSAAQAAAVPNGHAHPVKPPRRGEGKRSSKRKKKKNQELSQSHYGVSYNKDQVQQPAYEDNGHGAYESRSPPSPYERTYSREPAARDTYQNGRSGAPQIQRADYNQNVDKVPGNNHYSHQEPHHTDYNNRAYHKSQTQEQAARSRTPQPYTGTQNSQSYDERAYNGGRSPANVQLDTRAHNGGRSPANVQLDTRAHNGGRSPANVQLDTRVHNGGRSPANVQIDTRAHNGGRSPANVQPELRVHGGGGSHANVQPVSNIGGTGRRERSDQDHTQPRYGIKQADRHDVHHHHDNTGHNNRPSTNQDIPTESASKQKYRNTGVNNDYNRAQHDRADNPNYARLDTNDINSASYERPYQQLTTSRPPSSQSYTATEFGLAAHLTDGGTAHNKPVAPARKSRGSQQSLQHVGSNDYKSRPDSASGQTRY